MRDEIAKVMGFWLELGIPGFRVDAVPFFLEPSAGKATGDTYGDPHDYLRSLRRLPRPPHRRRHPAR